MQTKKASLIESIVNTFVGYCITVVFSPLLYWLAGVPVSFLKINLLAFMFTVLSVARNYVIRRWFNKVEKIQ